MRCVDRETVEERSNESDVLQENKNIHDVPYVSWLLFAHLPRFFMSWYFFFIYTFSPRFLSRASEYGFCFFFRETELIRHKTLLWI